MIAVEIYLDGQKVTPWVVKDDFPEWLETSVKGAGFFDWEVKAFSFRLHQSAPATPAIGLSVRIDVGEVTRFTGIVDSIDDAFSKTPSLTCQPLAVALKDVMAGAEGVDSSGHQRFRFEVRDATIGEAVAAALGWYDVNRDPRLDAVGAWTVMCADGADPVISYSPHGLTGPAVGVDYFEAAVAYQPAGAPDPETTRDHWVGVRVYENQLVIGRLRILWLWGSDGLYAEETVYYHPLQASGVNSDNTAPVAGVTSLAGWAAWDLPGTTTSHLGADQIVQHVRESAGMGQGPELAVEAVMDHPTGTWTVVRRFRPEERSGDVLYATWWGDPLIHRISGRWDNKPIIDLLKVFAMVSGRWLMVNGASVTLLPRESGSGEVLLPDSGLALDDDHDQQRRFDNPGGSIDIEVRDLSDSQGTGLEYSTGKVAALQFWYVDRFAGETVDTVNAWPISLLPAGLQLLSETQDGQVIGLDFSTDGKRFRVKTIQEGL